MTIDISSCYQTAGDYIPRAVTIAIPTKSTYLWTLPTNVAHWVLGDDYRRVGGVGKRGNGLEYNAYSMKPSIKNRKSLPFY